RRYGPPCISQSRREIRRLRVSWIGRRSGAGRGAAAQAHLVAEALGLGFRNQTWALPANAQCTRLRSTRLLGRALRTRRPRRRAPTAPTAPNTTSAHPGRPPARTLAP